MQKLHSRKNNFHKRKLPYRKKGRQKLHYKKDKQKFTTVFYSKPKHQYYRRKKTIPVAVSKQYDKQLRKRRWIIKNGKRKLRIWFTFLKRIAILLLLIGLLYVVVQSFWR